MTHVDWTAMTLGFAVGTVVGAVFFAGLAFGMRLALHTQSPIRVLALSAALRIVTLLIVGWIVVGQGGPWAALGYAIAFFVTRIIVTTLAREGVPARSAS